jgi:glycosyltransferase involved in cell wall biosynthesis
MTKPCILMVIHTYPPVWSAGAEPPLRFAQHLPEFGYEPVILTTDRYGNLPDDEAQRVYRASDLVHNLFNPLRRRKIEGVPQEAQYRVATIANRSWLGQLRDKVMVPDTKIGWLPAAVSLGHQLINQYDPVLIFSSSPPETNHLVAQQLSRARHLPWVADLRDGWLYEPPQISLRQPRLRRALEGYLERQVVERADALTTATDPITEDLCERYPRAAKKAVTITNGYDPAEFTGLVRRRPSNAHFLLVYTGSLSTGAEGRSADCFFRALAALVRADPAIPLQVRLIGNISSEEQAIVEALNLSDRVEFVPPVPRAEAHQHQRDADGLLLVTAPGRRSEATSKLFEYIGAGAPVLALAQGNAAAEIVQKYQIGIAAPADNPDAIAMALRELLRHWHVGTAWPGFAEAQRRFQWRNLTSKLANVFNKLCEER